MGAARGTFSREAHGMFHERVGATPDPTGSKTIVAAHRFTLAAQERFTALSGDRNPIHLASDAGRPGYPDRPVVHGIHVLLWGLDGLFEAMPDLPPVASLRVRFEKLVHVGDTLGGALDPRGDGKLRLNLTRDGQRVASLFVGFGQPSPAEEAGDGTAILGLPEEPRRLTFDEIARFEGRVPFTAARMSLSGLFPAATRGLGVSRVVCLACTSVVVGMICPGFHSLFAGLDLAARVPGEKDEALDVAVRDSDERFRRVLLGIAGGGWAGVLDTLYRPR